MHRWSETMSLRSVKPLCVEFIQFEWNKIHVSLEVFQIFDSFIIFFVHLFMSVINSFLDCFQGTSSCRRTFAFHLPKDVQEWVIDLSTVKIIKSPVSLEKFRAKLAEVRVLEQVVLIAVHVCKHLENWIAVKTKIHRVYDVCKITKRYIAHSSQVKFSKSGGNFLKSLENCFC